MKVYITICDSVYDDEYEGRIDTKVIQAFSSQEKARESIKDLADEMLRELKIGCGGDCENCAEEEKEYCHIAYKSDNPDKIRVYEMIDCYCDYTIQEMDLLDS